MGDEPDWQNECPNVASRNGKIFEEAQWSDCRFLVGSKPNEQLILAHKLILATASPVFERSFYGNFTEQADPILIPDITPDIFREILKYIYTDEIIFDSCEKACHILYVAKKYLLLHAVKRCVEYLSNNLSLKSVCQIYELSKLYNEESLKDKCLNFIANNGKEILSDPVFLEVESSTLLDIFSLYPMHINSEAELFEALNHYIIKHNIDLFNYEPEILPDPKVINNIKNAIKKIRFLTLNSQQFSKMIVNTKILTDSEALAILINISDHNSVYPLPDGFCLSKESRKIQLTFSNLKLSNTNIGTNPSIKPHSLTGLYSFQYGK